MNLTTPRRLRAATVSFTCGAILLAALWLTACGGGNGDVVGTCTIQRVNQSDIVEHVTIEKCQDDFLSTVGGKGWSFKPD